MFHKMPFLLVVILIAVKLGGDFIPPFYQSLLYGLSLSIKSGIVFFLPFIVFSLLFKTTVSFSNRATKMMLFILIAICCSNFISTLISYSVGRFAYHSDLMLHLPEASEALLPIGELSFPGWISNAQGLFLGVILGIIMGKFYLPLAQKISFQLEKMTQMLLKGILFTIPIFITGFIIKMNHDQLITYIANSYAWIFALIAVSVGAYIIFVYFIANQFQIKKTFNSIKNMMPAAIAGFGSMSSAAAMPLTILGAEKNSENPDIARSVVPTTVNIHLIGDCFAIPIFAFAVLKSFGVEEPSFLNYLIFAGYFVLAKFSVAAVPGGGILVMLPILETYLGFNSQMLSLITALYILFDPVITCANILGNGGFAKGIERLANQKKEAISLKEEAFYEL